jgi:hypothetical protein
MVYQPTTRFILVTLSIMVPTGLKVMAETGAYR